VLEASWILNTLLPPGLGETILNIKKYQNTPFRDSIFVLKYRLKGPFVAKGFFKNPKESGGLSPTSLNV
jgi:hypothetical protein